MQVSTSFRAEDLGEIGVDGRIVVDHQYPAVVTLIRIHTSLACNKLSSRKETAGFCGKYGAPRGRGPKGLPAKGPHADFRFPSAAGKLCPMGRLLLSLLILTAPVLALDKKKLLLIGQGPDGHPPGTHEFMAGVSVVKALLETATEIEVAVTKADEPWTDGPAMLDAADGAVLLVTQGAQFMQSPPERFAAFQKLAQRKGALVALHWSVGAKDAQYIDGQLKLLGGTRGGPQRKYKVLETDVRRITPEHPILAGVPDFRIHDEFYYRLELLPNEAPGFTPLLSAEVDGNPETVCWAWERPDGGRSFGYVGFHFHENWGRAEYRRLVGNAIRWALHLPIPEQGVAVEVPAEVFKLSPAPAAKDPLLK